MIKVVIAFVILNWLDDVIVCMIWLQSGYVITFSFSFGVFHLAGDNFIICIMDHNVYFC